MSFNIQNFILVKEYNQTKTLIDEGKLKDYLYLTEIKKNIPIVLELVSKQKANEEPIINKRPVIFDECNYCRQSSFA